MVRLITVAMSALLLSGCFGIGVKTEIVTETKVVYQEVKVPVNACPAPAIIPRPELLIRLVNEHTSDGETAKLYKATLIQLIDYSTQQQQIINEYSEISKKNGQPVETSSETQ